MPDSPGVRALRRERAEREEALGRREEAIVAQMRKAAPYTSDPDEFRAQADRLDLRAQAHLRIAAELRRRLGPSPST